MKKHKLVVRLFSLYILLTAAAILLIVVFASQAVERFYFSQKIEDMRVRSILVEQTLLQSGAAGSASLQQRSTDLGSTTYTRITIIDMAGQVLADSQEDPATMDLHNDRPEFIKAVSSGEGHDERWSYTLEQDYLYYARLSKLGTRQVVVRVSLPTLDLHTALQSIKMQISFIAVLVILLIAALNWYVSRIITRPIQVMETGARRFARGKFKSKLPESDIFELGSLARSLNHMADQIYDRIRVVTQQKNEQIAILTSMTEGVLALDANGRLLAVNRSAALMFGLKPIQAKGRPIHEIIRHVGLNDFVTAVFEHKKRQECRITVFQPEERILNVIGSRMPSKKGASGGAVIVLTDLTRIQKLEGVRREFVANVSHELKTPITAIQGYVETLQDGAMQDPKHAKRFLEIIAKHSDRLGQIVDDLLELSRIEELSMGDEDANFENIMISDLMAATIQNCQVAADLKTIKIHQEVEWDGQVLVNPKLMAHALGNLLDNAIKYSEAASQIVIRCRSEKKRGIIEIIDRGPGIEAEQLPRIFERFYRIDKGRSRDVGGTGLGLAIVKYIVRIHGGEVDVQSTPGEGSVFRITFSA